MGDHLYYFFLGLMLVPALPRLSTEYAIAASIIIVVCSACFLLGGGLMFLRSLFRSKAIAGIKEKLGVVSHSLKKTAVKEMDGADVPLTSEVKIKTQTSGGIVAGAAGAGAGTGTGPRGVSKVHPMNLSA